MSHQKLKSNLSKQSLQRTNINDTFFYLLFLASSRTERSNSSRQKLLQPTISNSMVEAYALSKADMAQHVRHNLNRYTDKKMEDSHYFNWLINFPYFNQATAILIAFCEFGTSPISQNKNAHSQAITALTFLPAPKKCCNDKWISPLCRQSFVTPAWKKQLGKRLRSEVLWTRNCL